MARTVEDIDKEVPFGVSVGKGWFGILNQLIADLDRDFPGWKPDQIKEKFGTLRFYATPPEGISHEDNKRFLDRINRAEAASATICEWCGEPGSLDRDRYWLLTLCEHHKKRRAEGWRPFREEK